MHAFSRAALDLGAAEFLCTFDPETAHGTARLLSHLDAVRLARVALFHRALNRADDLRPSSARPEL